MNVAGTVDAVPVFLRKNVKKILFFLFYLLKIWYNTCYMIPAYLISYGRSDSFIKFFRRNDLHGKEDNQDRCR